MTQYVGLNLLTGTRVNIEQYGGQSEVLVPFMAIVYRCRQTPTAQAAIAMVSHKS